MILNRLKIAGTDELVNISIDNDKITNVSTHATTGLNDNLQLSFGNAIVFPGLSIRTITWILTCTRN
jgi:hypothetical protein